MSRFWAGADGLSSSESDNSSDDSVSTEGSSGGDVGGGGGAGGENKWAELSESSSEDEARIVKSAKDRAFQSFRVHATAIRNGMKINDWIKVQEEFDSLARTVSKSQKIIAEYGGIPRFYVRLLVDLEDKARQCLADKASLKKLSAGNGRALNRMKLTLRKHNKPYASIMEEYRKNPVASSSSSSESEDAESTSSSDGGGKDSDDSSVDSSKDSDSDSSSSTSSSSEEKQKKKEVLKKKKKVAVVSATSSEEEGMDSSDGDDARKGDGDDDDDVEWGSDSSGDLSDADDSDDDDDDDEGALSQLKGRARWLKKTTGTKEKTVKDKGEREKQRLDAKRKTDAIKAAAAAATAAATAGSTKSILPDNDTLTPSVLYRKCSELILSRGRKGTDNALVVRQLEALSKLAQSRFGDDPRVEIPIIMHTVTAKFDLQRNMDDYLSTAVWRSVYGHLHRILSTLEKNKELRLGPMSAEDLAEDLVNSAGSRIRRAALAGTDEFGAVAAVAEDEQLVNPETGETETEDERAERTRVDKLKKMSKEERKTIRVVGSLPSFLSRLEEEYIKSLQQTSPHSTDYVLRLRDEGKLVDLLKMAQHYCMRRGDNERAAEMARLQVEHLYYRHDSIAFHVDRALAFSAKYGEISMLHPSCISSSAIKSEKKVSFKIVHPGSASGKPHIEEVVGASIDSKESISDLCLYVYKHGNDRSRTRAMLCHIFHHALHDRFLESRDLLLMSKLQDTIGNAGADISTMILFNRMMVTIGLCAFRKGRIWDAHQCLSDVCSGRVRELLAQGVSTGKFSDKTSEQEKAEKRRQIPYHMHINLDLLEATHLISAMLLEVPNMALSGDGSSGGRRRVISRQFRKNFDYYERQVFTSAMPEQTRDFVMCAATALMKGEWKKCADLLTRMEVWQLVPGEDSAANVKAMLIEKAKLEGLRTYLFAYSSYYDSLSLGQLCKMFEMEKNEVHSVTSKMMIGGELHASWDQPTESIVLRKVEPSNLQTLALQFSERAAALVEANERLLDVRAGSYGGYKDEWKGRPSSWQDRGDGHRRPYSGDNRSGGRSSGRGMGRGFGRGGRSGRGSSMRGGIGGGARGRSGGGLGGRTYRHDNRW